jgi:hypothetical protein
MFQINTVLLSLGFKSEASNKRDADRKLLPASAGFLLGLLSDPAARGDMFL